MDQCLKFQEKHPDVQWSDILKINHRVNGMVEEAYRIMNFRDAAGWECDEGGWISPDGILESTWEDWNLAFPEDPEEYQEALKSQNYKDMMAEHNILTDSCHARLGTTT